MGISIKQYPPTRICDEFHAIIAFLKQYGAKGYNKHWHWGRFEWLISHIMLNESTIPLIGMFMDGDTIAGIVTHDMRKPMYILLNPSYNYLKPRMADYAYECAASPGISSIYADNSDTELISIIKNKGYTLSEKAEYCMILDCAQKLTYTLEEGFYFTDYSKDKDIDKYVEVIHRGFENKGKPPTGLTESYLNERPNDNHKLKLFIADTNGNYAAHCGTWYMLGTDICYIEPVVTVPEHRQKGLGKAVVYECVNRCVDMGAKKAMVISNQQFYHSLGFETYSVCQLWDNAR